MTVKKSNLHKSSVDFFFLIFACYLLSFVCLCERTRARVHSLVGMVLWRHTAQPNHAACLFVSFLFSFFPLPFFPVLLVPATRINGTINHGWYTQTLPFVAPILGIFKPESFKFPVEYRVATMNDGRTDWRRKVLCLRRFLCSYISWAWQHWQLKHCNSG